MDPIPIIGAIPVVFVAAFLVLLVKKGAKEGLRIDIKEAIAGITVLVIAVFLMSSLTSSVEEGDFELYDCVPLSDFGDGAAIVGDCVEVVTIGGTDYVRMTDLGTFTAKYGEDEEVRYTVTKAHMDLVIWAGQSNAAGSTNASLYNGPATVPPGKAFYLGFDDPPSIVRINELDGATVCDMIADDGTMRVSQMYPWFCGDYFEETNHRLITANTAIRGRAIAKWDDGQEADVYFKDVINALKTQCDGKIEITPVAVLWVQGEGDVYNSQAYYLERFTALLEKLETGYYGYKFPHIFSSLPKYPGYDYSHMINPALAQIEAAALDSHFEIASSLAYRATDAQHRDSLHFTQEYYNWVGEAFARCAAKATGFAPVKQTIVLALDPGEVDTLPSKVTFYGTSGTAFLLHVRWAETGVQGEYEGTPYGNPSDTVIADGLAAKAQYDEGGGARLPTQFR